MADISQLNGSQFNWVVGDVGEIWRITLTRTSNIVVDLGQTTPDSFSLLITDTNLGTVTNGTGVFSIYEPSQGIISYQPSALDVASAGLFRLTLTVNFSSGGAESFSLGKINLLSR